MKPALRELVNLLAKIAVEQYLDDIDLASVSNKEVGTDHATEQDQMDCHD